MFTGKFNKDTAQAAYKAGHEPPGVVKARMRHERGGGVRTPAGTPKGRGATRLMLAQRWANACEKAKDKQDDKHRRWRAWFAEQAPQRDQQWREKQANKIAKSESRAEKFARARGLINPLADRTERQAWDENARRDNDTEQMVEQARKEAQQLREREQAAADDPARPLAAVANVGGQQAATEQTTTKPDGEQPTEKPDGEQPTEQKPNAAAPAAGGAASIPTQNTGTTGGTTVYQQAVVQLHNHADEVDGYMNALSLLGDEMAGVGWGAEVHGPLTDMRNSLQQVAGRYRDLAERIQKQGDAVNDAYDDAPWAPDRAVLLQS